MDAAARGAHEAGRVTVRPVEVHECHARGLELPLMVFEELVLACVTAQIVAVWKRDGLGFAHVDDTNRTPHLTRDHAVDMA
ncbi:hypothetical protein GCM10023193_77440 [Planotetraspora kaengkrachanensis]|uniref:Uncharacterized protein n=1 Tax=Planotetraspora kaengkrachanensis TaxID=575193 RepID=A0A8J3VC36_9ACTN|nr:hypothetical protein Pka01_76340 [Planotetraspora kaengkrachanensis]